MKNNVTELVFILDKSGSMAGLEKTNIGGFKAMIEKQKKEDGTCYVSTVLFSDESQMLHDRLPLEQVPQMTDRDYEVCGCTALLDAIGDCIRHIENIHKYARAEDLPAHTLFVITTDGQENASHRYTGEKIKKMIGRQKEKYGWEFLFIGANIDAVATASRYGIEKDRAVNYLADEKGTRTLFRAVGNAVCSIRNKSSLGADWQREIKEDFCSRSRQNG